MGLNPDQYRLTEAEHKAIFDNDIKPNLFAGAKSSEKPVAVIFGGQPGAGKSVVVDAAMRELEQRGGAVQIIGDDLRSYHPKYEPLMESDDKTAAFYTDRDTGQWIENAIAEAQKQQVNIVIEGTMRDGNKVAETMQRLRNAGYEIDARVLAVNERFSQQGILQRYENQKLDRGTGRMTTPQAHQAALNGLPATVERIERDKLADRVTLYRRGAEAIYTNELNDGKWGKVPQARVALETEHLRPMSLQERRSYVDGFDKLAELMARPERQASAEELKTVDDLRQRAMRELSATIAEQRGIEFVAVATPREQHLLSIYERYEQQLAQGTPNPRLVPDQAMSGEKTLATYAAAFDRVRVIDQTGATLYDSASGKGNALEALAEGQRMTDSKLASTLKAWQDIGAAAQGRNAPADYLAAISQHEERIEGMQKSRIHDFSMSKLDTNAKTLAADPRFVAHSGDELLKAGYFRGFHEKAGEFRGRAPDFPTYDGFVSDKANLEQLPDVPDLRGMTIERERQPHIRDIDGYSL